MATTTTASATMNGMDLKALFGTLDAIRADPGLAAFQFRASNRWIDGGLNRTTISGFFGAGQEDASRVEPFVYSNDVLAGAARREPRGEPGGVRTPRAGRVPHDRPRAPRGCPGNLRPPRRVPVRG